MPLYDYKCTSCGRVTEVRHGFDTRNEAPCPHCGGTLARVFNAAPIVFKGSGFYINDSRAKSTPAAAGPKADAKPESTGESGPAEPTPAAAKAEPKSEAAPAAKPVASKDPAA